MGHHRAGVTGSPIGHSLSPVLHRAAYAALGLEGWRYDAIEVPQGSLGRFVSSLGPEWVGLSVTMPGKEEALALADRASDAAQLTGAANTLVRDGQAWLADNTDVDGLVLAIGEMGVSTPARAMILGGGATARSALLAAQRLGAPAVTVVVRDEVRPETARMLARLDLDVDVVRFADGPIVLDSENHDLVVATLPASAPAPEVRLGGSRTGAPAVMDVVYAPWPSPFAAAVADLGPAAPPVSDGTAMLLHQAGRQVRLMTGHDGPVEAMRTALTRAGEKR